jgi:hypothetical protein
MTNASRFIRVPALALPAGFLAAALGTGIALARVEPADVAVYKQAEAMHYVLGSKRAVGYFMGQKGECRLTMMIAEAVDPEVALPPPAARLRFSMSPGQSARFDSAEGSEMTLTCGPHADSVEVKRAGTPRS